MQDNHTYFAEGILVHNVSCRVATLSDGRKVVTTEDGKSLVSITETDKDGDGIPESEYADIGFFQNGIPSLDSPQLTEEERNYILSFGDIRDLSFNPITGIVTQTKGQEVYLNSEGVLVSGLSSQPFSELGFNTQTSNSEQGSLLYQIQKNEYLIGWLDGFSNSMNSTAEAIIHYDQTGQLLYTAITHPIETGGAIIDSLGNSINRFINGNPNEKGEVVGGFVFDAFAFIATDGIFRGGQAFSGVDDVARITYQADDAVRLANETDLGGIPSNYFPKDGSVGSTRTVIRSLEFEPTHSITMSKREFSLLK